MSWIWYDFAQVAGLDDMCSETLTTRSIDFGYIQKNCAKEKRESPSHQVPRFLEFNRGTHPAAAALPVSAKICLDLNKTPKLPSRQVPGFPEFGFVFMLIHSR